MTDKTITLSSNKINITGHIAKKTKFRHPIHNEHSNSTTHTTNWTHHAPNAAKFISAQLLHYL